MTSIDDVLNDGAAMQVQGDFSLDKQAPIYTEDLDVESAKTLIGSKYKPDHTYKLITQETSTIVAMFDATGSLVDEFTLDSESLVSSLTEINQERLLRSDIPPTLRKDYDLYEVKDRKLGYIIPVAILIALGILGISLLIYTVNYLV